MARRTGTRFGRARRRKKRRSMTGYRKGALSMELDLATLAGRTLVSVLNSESVTERARLSSVAGIYTLSGYTLVSEGGPILFGLAHPDYTDAEIEAWIENSGSWSEGNLVAKEIANRRIRQIGVFETPADGVADVVTYNDGRPVKTRLNWLLITGQSIRLWAYNMGTAAMVTTDADVNFEGHANLFRA